MFAIGRTIKAKDGQECLEKLKEEVKMPDVILLDIIM